MLIFVHLYRQAVYSLCFLFTTGGHKVRGDRILRHLRLLIYMYVDIDIDPYIYIYIYTHTYTYTYICQ